MLKKVEIIALCKHIALDYDGWEFVAGSFKYKKLKHTVLMVEPAWTFSPSSALCQPIVAVANKKIDKLYSQIYRNSGWSHHMDIIDIKTCYPLTFRIYDIEKDDAENRIRAFLEDGLSIIEKTYDISSEEALLTSIPIIDEQVVAGIKTAVIQAYLGNPDFVRNLYQRIIDSDYLLYADVLKNVMDHFGIEPKE
jgi:hypothetical protein